MLTFYQLFCDFKNSLHVPIWVLLILGAHPFSGRNLPRFDPTNRLTIDSGTKRGKLQKEIRKAIRRMKNKKAAARLG